MCKGVWVICIVDVGLISWLYDKIHQEGLFHLQVVYRKISERSMAQVVGMATVLVDATMLENSEFAAFLREDLNMIWRSRKCAMMYHHRVDYANTSSRRLDLRFTK